MARSKRDILDTEAMLVRLTNLLVEHDNREGSDYWIGRARGDAELLRRISMTLRNWFEMECGSDRGAIERDEEDGKPYWRSAHDHKRELQFGPIPDREAGARKRLAAILKRYPTLTAYVQTDPRGCALYILRPGDVPAGEDASSYYSRGLAVFK